MTSAAITQKRATPPPVKPAKPIAKAAGAKAGSDAGQLHEAFRALATRITSQLKFAKAIKKATLMPGVIIAVLQCAFIISQVKIVPQVEEMLSGVGQEPDGLTAISFKISHFTQAVWHIYILSVIGIAVTITRSSKVRGIIMGIAMSKWRLFRLLIMPAPADDVYLDNQDAALQRDQPCQIHPCLGQQCHGNPFL